MDQHLSIPLQWASVHASYKESLTQLFWKMQLTTTLTAFSVTTPLGKTFTGPKDPRIP